MMISLANLAVLRQRIGIEEKALSEIGASAAGVGDQRDPPAPGGDRTGSGA